jgi:hypothetical protein
MSLRPSRCHQAGGSVGTAVPKTPAKTPTLNTRTKSYGEIPLVKSSVLEIRNHRDSTRLNYTHYLYECFFAAVNIADVVDCEAARNHVEALISV